MDIARYLQRINFTGALYPSTETLFSLHEHHAYHVPFENLDIHYKRLFGLQIERVFEKVVTNIRGGFCYELNLLFNHLLANLGFKSGLISCRILTEGGEPGPEFDHMAIVVKTDKDYLVDIGFGDLFITPLEIRAGIQHDGRNFFRLEYYEHMHWTLSMSADGQEFHQKYTFTLQEFPVACFEALCYDKQTNPNSYFVKNLVCTKPTKSGRITIFNDKLIEKDGNQRTEIMLADNYTLRTQLRDKFDVTINRTS